MDSHDSFTEFFQHWPTETGAIAGNDDDTLFTLMCEGPGKCEIILLVWSPEWVGSNRQKVITWANVDTDWCHRATLVSQGHNELRWFNTDNNQAYNSDRVDVIIKVVNNTQLLCTTLFGHDVLILEMSTKS